MTSAATKRHDLILTRLVRQVIAAAAAITAVLQVVPITYTQGIAEGDFEPHRQHQQQQQRPHIIIVLADSLGWSDVSFHGNGQIPTPNLDTLALNGVTFKQLYTQPTSSAARASLLTGKYAHRLGLQDMFLLAGIRAALPLENKLLPEYLRELGYETHLVGKWHLGYHSKRYLPTSRGFDTFYGSYLDRLHYYNLTYDEQFWSNSSTGFDFHQNGAVLREAQGHHITALLDARVDAILRARTKPMFLMVSHVVPGGSETDMAVSDDDRFHPHIRHIDHKRRATYAAAVQSLDTSVGNLISSLDAAGMLNNSVVLFMAATGGRSLSDQLQPTAASPWPLRGQRFSVFEGGIRSPGIVWSVQLRDRGYASDKLYHITDWLPTFVQLAGGDITGIEDIDGLNIWNSLNSPEIRSPRWRILHQLNPYQANMFAVRVDHYKLISGGDSLSVYNDWYPPQGNEEDTEYVDHLMTSSRTYELLKKLPGFRHGHVGWRRDLLIHCDLGEAGDLRYTHQIEFNRTQCNPTKEACLFDVLTDPCELDNLAKELPRYVKMLRRWALKHLPQVQPAQMTVRSMDHFEPKADPRFHQGNWEPWTDESIENK